MCFIRLLNLLAFYLFYFQAHSISGTKLPRMLQVNISYTCSLSKKLTNIVSFFKGHIASRKKSTSYNCFIQIDILIFFVYFCHRQNCTHSTKILTQGFEGSGRITLTRIRKNHTVFDPEDSL